MKLLVVETPSILQPLCELLRFDGHEVAAASTPAEATAHLAREHFDAVAAALELPRGSGAEVLRAARDALPAARLVLLVNDPWTVLRSLPTGAAVVVKPIDYDALLAALGDQATTVRSASGDRARPAGRRR